VKATHKLISAFGYSFCVLLCAYAQSPRLTTSQARSHVGEAATVCGTVASTHFANTTRGQPTFLNLDEPYPNQVFTALIWGSDRAKFGTPENDFRSKRVCVSGKITLYRGAPEMILYQPSQIRIE
jgi:hypothetical protein